jgi:lipopolysaccharide export system protein LptA
MDKQRYAVSVQARTINQTDADSSNPIEILATQEEVDELNQLFKLEDQVDVASFAHMPVSALEYENQGNNKEYDTNLIKIYKAIYQLGTLKTREHIEAMNILV